MIILKMICHVIRLAVNAKNPALILFLAGESELVLRPDEGRTGRDCNRQNRARQFFPGSRFYGEILVESEKDAAQRE